MKGSCLVMLLLLFTYLLFIVRSDEDSFQLNDDVLGLIVFKSSLEDPFSHLGSWNEDDNSPCGWRFIKCNNGGRVSQVGLDGLALSGKIGRGLEKLEKLEVLSLANNNFTGNLNQELSFIDKLESINLSHNSLSGNIPSSFANLTSLKFLDLSENLLSGPLEDRFFDTFKSLRFISLSRNHLEGPIPSSLSACTSLNHLNFSKNHFSGDFNFPLMFKSLTRLRTLDLSRNALSGQVPSGIKSTMFTLKVVMLQGNEFSGSIPSDIGLCLHLNRLDISENYFTGAIPDSMQRLNALAYLDLANNMISGLFPSWINKMSSLEHVDFSGNVLEGSVISSIGELKSLKYFNLMNNKLSGIIPNSLGDCTALSVLKLRGNFFNDSVPPALFESLALVQVDLSGNELTGSIVPPSSGSSKVLQTLEVLDLSDNNLSGAFPSQVGVFSNLQYLNLSWNSFQSRLPQELGTLLPHLTVLDLRNSGLIGSIPGDICHSSNLEVLQLDGNSLAGPIPNMIGYCSSLSLLSLSHNSLSGPIPQSICVLKKLKILKLEYNQLGGEMPQGLGKLDNLLAVNISYNRLIGRLPLGSIFQNLDESAFEGNLGICSPLLKGPCKMNVPKPLVLDPYAYGDQNQGGGGGGENEEPLRNSRHHNKKFLSVSAIVAIAASVVIVVGVLMISLVNASARKRQHGFIEKGLESMCSTSSSRSGSLNTNTGKLILFDSKSSPDCMSSSLESVLSKATEIGQGVFGTVYKATLLEGRVLAIKKLVTSNNNYPGEDFDRQVRILSKAKHPNLITLRGYYWSPQIQLLVSDYAPEGSLHAKLHQSPPSAAPLSWPTRFKIMLGTAKGLAHLHHSFRPPIIHYSIKPSNVLLDENMNPKISDFGLARLLNKHLVSTNRFQNTLGYVAPELACQSVRVNEKCDVFGFGVLILEIVTGRRAVEYSDDNVLILNDHVQAMVDQGNAVECVDPNMAGRYPEDEVLPVIKLALVCTSRIPSSRPSMAEVVQILHVIKTPIPQGH